MSAGPIAVLQPTDLQFVPDDPGFVSLAADFFSWVPILETNIDRSLGEFAQSLSDQYYLGLTMDSDIADLAQIVSEIDAISPIIDLSTIWNLLAFGDSALYDAISLIG